jgi:hypothetical protein
MLPETRGRELESSVEVRAETVLPGYVAPPLPTLGHK